MDSCRKWSCWLNRVPRMPPPPQVPSEREMQNHKTSGHAVFRSLVRASARGGWRRSVSGCRRRVRLTSARIAKARCPHPWQGIGARRCLQEQLWARRLQHHFHDSFSLELGVEAPCNSFSCGQRHFPKDTMQVVPVQELKGQKCGRAAAW